MGRGGEKRMQKSFDLANPALVAFVQDHQYNYVSHEEFLSLSMPEGVSHEEAWEVLSFARCLQARPYIEAGDEDGALAETHYYWVATPSMLEVFAQLAYLCNDSNPLAKDLEKLKGKEALQDLLVEELRAATLRDGLEVEREELGALVRGEELNSSDQLILVKNCLRILDDLSVAASTGSLSALSPEELLALYNALCSGVPEMALKPLRTLADDLPLLKKERSEWLQDVARNINSPYHWGPHHFFGMLMSSDIFWENRPFGQFDGLMELIVWHYACLYHHEPALRFVPLSKMRLDWEHGLIPVDSPIFEHGNAIVKSRFGEDSTPYVQVMARLLERGVERLQAIARKAREADEARKATIAADGRLTLRQKSFLQSLVDDPNKPFTLVDYQQRFDIALSTARADMEGLVRMRWLEDEFEGKRRVYRLRKS